MPLKKNPQVKFSEDPLTLLDPQMLKSLISGYTLHIHVHGMSRVTSEKGAALPHTHLFLRVRVGLSIVVVPFTPTGESRVRGERGGRGGGVYVCV